MKNISVFFLLLLAIVACNNSQETPSAKEDNTLPAADSNLALQPEIELYIWKVNAENCRQKNPAYTPALLQVDTLIKGINQMHEGVLLQKIKQGHDTLYTVIPHSGHLTEEMGSTGAELYVADVVLNLTELPGVKYVHIQMEEGSHAQTGTWQKEDFAHYKIVE